jgi:hypothetical protein
VSVSGHIEGLTSIESSFAASAAIRSMSNPLARRVCGDPSSLSWNDSPVGLCNGGKSCSYSTLTGESANVTCFSSSERGDSSDSVIGPDAGGVVRAEARVVVVVLPVDDSGGEGRRLIVCEEV